jgi:hypothetical protein
MRLRPLFGLTAELLRDSFPGCETVERIVREHAATVATLAGSSLCACETRFMVFLPNRKAIVAEQRILNEPLYAAEREPLLGLLRALRRAASPHNFFALHRDLLVRYRSRQEAIDALRRHEDSEKVALKHLTAGSPADRSAVRKQQERLARLRTKIAAQQALQSLLRTVGDGLAWKALGYDRAAITVLGNGTRVDRLTSGEGLDSELAVLAEYWNRGVFAIHNDLTSCLRHGDVTAIFPGGRREVVEVKATQELSPTSPQMRRLRDATTLVNQRRHTFADGTVHALVDLDTPYRTGLSHLRALVPKARRTGYASSRVGTCQMIAVVDNRLTAREPETFLREHPRALARAGLGPTGSRESYQHSTLVRRMREKKHSFAALAPLSIFPLASEDLVDLLLGYLDLFTALDVTALGKSFERRGIEVRFAERSERDELFLEARRIVGDRELFARAGPTVREQLLLELMTPANAIACVEATLDAVELEPAPQPVARVVALADERRVWESAT